MREKVILLESKGRSTRVLSIRKVKRDGGKKDDYNIGT